MPPGFAVFVSVIAAAPVAAILHHSGVAEKVVKEHFLPSATRAADRRDFGSKLGGGRASGFLGAVLGAGYGDQQEMAKVPALLWWGYTPDFSQIAQRLPAPTMGTNTANGMVVPDQGMGI